jgi:hypothetical protein
MTTTENIKTWLYSPHYSDTPLKETKKKYSHMLVVCDTFDWDDYPVHVERTENIHEKIKEYSINMQKIMEIYNYDLDLDTQLNKGKSWNI